MKYKTILFDFDYTLVDSSEGIVESICYALQCMNLPIPTESKIKKTIGLSLEETFTVLTGISQTDILERLRIFFLEQSRIIMPAKVKIFDDTIPVLKMLKKKGLRIGIVSAKDNYTIRRISELCGFDKYLDIIVGEDDVMEQKPNPEQILKVMNSLKEKKSQILFVGDSLVDCLTAKNASVDFCAVITGVTKAEEFTGQPCIGVASNLKEAICYITCMGELR